MSAVGKVNKSSDVIADQTANLERFDNGSTGPAQPCAFYGVLNGKQSYRRSVVSDARCCNG